MSEWDNQQGMTNFWQNETQARSNELAEKARQAHDAAMGRIDADKRAQTAAAQFAEASRGYESESDHLVDLGEKLLEKLKRTKALLAKAEADNASYRALLARPIQEIANASPQFNATYLAERELLATWIVNQRAYRELAMELGAQCGKSRDEVLALVKLAKAAVLENQTRHGNDSKDEPFLAPYLESIKAKFNAK